MSNNQNNLAGQKLKDFLKMQDQLDMINSIGLSHTIQDPNFIINIKNESMAKKKVLGRGLSSLLSDVDKPKKSKSKTPSTVRHLSINVTEFIVFMNEYIESNKTVIPPYVFRIKKYLEKTCWDNEDYVKIEKKDLLSVKGVGIKSINYFYNLVTIYCQKKFQQTYEVVDSNTEIMFFKDLLEIRQYCISDNDITTLEYNSSGTNVTLVSYETVKQIYSIIGDKVDRVKNELEYTQDQLRVLERSNKTLEKNEERANKILASRNKSGLQKKYNNIAGIFSELYRVINDNQNVPFWSDKQDFNVVKIVEDLYSKLESKEESSNESNPDKENRENDYKIEIDRLIEVIKKQDGLLDEYYNKIKFGSVSKEKEEDYENQINRYRQSNIDLVKKVEYLEKTNIELAKSKIESGGSSETLTANQTVKQILTEQDNEGITIKIKL